MAKKTQKGSKGRITIDRETCKACYLCISVCPKKLISVSEELNQKGYYPAVYTEEGMNDGRVCTGCTLCATICPDIAIEVYRG